MSISTSSFLLALGLALVLAPWRSVDGLPLEEDGANSTDPQVQAVHSSALANHSHPLPHGNDSHPLPHGNHTHPHGNGTIALKLSPGSQSAQLGELAMFCEEEKNPCTIANSSCVLDRCECDPGYVSVYNQSACVLKASQLGDPCEEDIQCTAGISADIGRTKCLSRQCVCAVGLELRDNKCQRPRRLGTECENTSECEVIDSICQEMVCNCPPAFYPNANNDKCMPKSQNLNERCEEDAQCEDLGEAQCRNGLCQCLNTMVVVSGKCTRRKALGDDCQDSAECQVNDEKDKRVCTQSSCQCDIGSKQRMDICIPSSAHWTSVNLALLLLSISYRLFF